MRYVIYATGRGIVASIADQHHAVELACAEHRRTGLVHHVLASLGATARRHPAGGESLEGDLGSVIFAGGGAIDRVARALAGGGSGKAT